MPLNDISSIVMKYRDTCDRIDDHLSMQKIELVRKKLLDWYYSNRRLLPWRGDSLPDCSKIIPKSGYGTWISEVMLQQTRVETVIPYYLKWMEKYPDVISLSEATPDEINFLWSGLGYYRRAQMILKGACKIVNDMEGQFPQSAKDLQSIPGIGPYTAGAISSIAFNQPEPLVDGNVIRVFSRMYAIKQEMSQSNKAMEKRCWDIAGKLLDRDKPGDFNQALMELGATVCTPKNPKCELCPMKAYCSAYRLVNYKLEARRTGTAVAVVEGVLDLPSSVTDFPRRAPKKKAKEISYAVCVLCADVVLPLPDCPSGTTNPDGSRDRGHSNRGQRLDSGSPEADGARDSLYLFVRRPSTGLLAGQWEFPNTEMAAEFEGEGEEACDLQRPGLWKRLRRFLREELRVDADVNSRDWTNEQRGNGKSDQLELDSQGNTQNAGPAALPPSLACTVRAATATGGTEAAERPVSLEPLTHIFSHQIHRLFPLYLRVSARVGVEGENLELTAEAVGNPGWAWLSASGLEVSECGHRWLAPSLCGLALRFRA